jgi:hypothetical protein
VVAPIRRLRSNPFCATYAQRTGGPNTDLTSAGGPVRSAHQNLSSMFLMLASEPCVHISAFEKAGLTNLKEGQNVAPAPRVDHAQAEPRGA